ncbi:ribonuclease E inhibitor RraB [Pseudoalteromonas sp. MMG010]|uniref:ribonuclease E inhibitor RraB n=1 Tax=Pseudoalteromonas sp. MMG010 TaxID=2822685 RepID=UPI001B39F2B9|nr:ribonuclease E inhibitor RraB [Pseudoalteromonas sp. MMG010]MBQ4831662.1 ribonuclease E inhibitor RraB [Pseudoalteromonas sp. MMG010]
MQFPDDDNGQLLAEIAQAGVDLTQMHQIDFYILFEQQDDAKKFAKDIVLDALVQHAEVEKCKDTGVWEVITQVKMVPQHTLLGQAEQYLESIANNANGYGDGWGLMEPQDT